MRIAVIGGNGQLGSDLMRVIEGNPSHEGIALTRRDLDVTAVDQVRTTLTRVGAAVVINTAAYHKVDLCEDEPEKTLLVNAGGARNVALVCHELSALSVYISSDYVFDGAKDSPYVEVDTPNPVSVYGVAKLAAEHMVRLTGGRHIVVRSTGLYGVAGASGKGGNFVETMLKLASEGRTLRVVADQVVTPTYTSDLATNIVRLVEGGAEGLFHLTNTGECSWYEFATKIFELSGTEADLHPTTSADFGAKAKRPPYSVLDNSRLRELGWEDMRAWQDALADYLKERTRKVHH